MALKYPRVFEIIGDAKIEKVAEAISLTCIGGVMLRDGDINITTLVLDSARFPDRRFLIFTSHRKAYAEKAAQVSLLREVDLLSREPINP